MYSVPLTLQALITTATDDILIFMPSTSKMLRGHIAFGLVHPTVRPFARTCITPLRPLISLEPCMLGF